MTIFDSVAGHIHAGNVIIVDGFARLLDVENFVLGVPSFYRPFFLQLSKISTVEHIDVYSFGHLLYEMSMGFPLQESIARHPIECSESLSKYYQLSVIWVIGLGNLIFCIRFKRFLLVGCTVHLWLLSFLLLLIIEIANCFLSEKITNMVFRSQRALLSNIFSSAPHLCSSKFYISY